MLLYLLQLLQKKEANRDKPDITKVEVHPFNQRILWKYTGLFCKQLELDLKCIQQAVLPNLKVKSRKKKILSSKCVGSVLPTPIGICAGKKPQDISLTPDVIGFQALLKHLQMLWTCHCSQLLNPEAPKAITYTIQLFLVALLSDPVSSVFNVITDTSVTCWFLWSELFKASAFNEESKDKKHHTHTKMHYFCLPYSETLEQKNF